MTWIESVEAGRRSRAAMDSCVAEGTRIKDNWREPLRSDPLFR